MIGHARHSKVKAERLKEAAREVNKCGEGIYGVIINSNYLNRQSLTIVIMGHFLDLNGYLVPLPSDILYALRALSSCCT